MRKTIRFEELNTADLQAAGFDKVILPIGSCESHGDHLPFGIDAMIAYGLALAVAAQDIKIKHPEIGIAVLGAWWTAGLAMLPKDMWQHHQGYGHGGEAETSVAMAVVPELVDPSRARGMVDEKDLHVKEFWNYQELTDYGASARRRRARRASGSRPLSSIISLHSSNVRRRRDGSSRNARRDNGDSNA
jgi:creatinine amidohydrolase/Fe(II)-dependent formamide hydrolase-like protein